MGQFQSHSNLGWNFKCQRYLGSITAAVLAVLAVMTPVAMVLLPRMQIVPLRSEQLRCPAECEGLLITLTVKLVLLVLGSWAVFWRPTRATMPRIFFLRTLVLLLVFVTTFAYCLFYGVRVVEQQDQLDYKVSRPKKISIPDFVRALILFCFVFFFVFFRIILNYNVGHCDFCSVASRRSTLCPLRCRFAAGNSPNAAQILPARYPQSRRHF